MAKKEWKIWIGDDCPHCGGDLEVFSESPTDEDSDTVTYAYDEEEVKCVEGCGFKSSIVVHDDETAGIHEGNIEELEKDGE